MPAHASSLRSRIVIEATTGFPSEATGVDKSAEHRAWPVLGISKIPMKDFHDGEAHVETDHIRQLEGAHWVTHAEAHHGIDVLP